MLILHKKHLEKGCTTSAAALDVRVKIPFKVFGKTAKKHTGLYDRISSTDDFCRDLNARQMRAQRTAQRWRFSAPKSSAWWCTQG